MVVTETRIEGVKLHARGKVRDVYDLGDRLLFIATDRISAFDVILPNGIPDKGRVLTQISIFWFRLLEGVVANHVITADVRAFPEPLPRHAALLEGRSMLVRRLKMFPVECVVRGYLAGSGWKEYQQHGTVCGIPLPSGLRQADRLSEPIFTPATKAVTGHDENIPFATMAQVVGSGHAHQLRSLSLAIYKKAADHAAARGIILADTKFEFGLQGDRIVLADEVLTPDSSRFWDGATWAPGTSPASYDKQFVRDHLEETGWNKQPPAPELPARIVEGTRARYLEIHAKLTGQALA
jgi:phosphoribosylaminoimidazole-succinocarboxamide synthase